MAFKITKRLKQAPDGKKPVKKKKTFKKSKGSKFVLFLGDEGAILVYISNKAVEHRQFIPHTSQASLNEVTKTFDAHPKAPILLVIDTMDQSYVQQTLPPVSSLSVNKLIKRRLERDFPASDIKGALLLGREKEGRKDWNFLMISVDKTPQITTWFDFVTGLSNPFAGIHLAAVESEILGKALEQAVPGDQPPSEWKFLVAHTKVGGFRQVIMRNNRIIFTRLAQPVGESSPEVVAGNIEQEIFNTIEYMKRISYNAQASLDIYIIGSGSLKNLINKNRFHANALHVLTPYEVAEYLRIKGATQPNDQFADVILAAAIGFSRKHVLTLNAPQFSPAAILNQVQRLQRLVAVMGGIAILGYGGTIGIDLVSALSQAWSLKAQKIANQKKLDVLHGKITDANVNVESVSELIDLYWQLLSEKLSPIPFIQQTALIDMPSDANIESLQWDYIPAKSGSAGALVSVAPLPSAAHSFPQNNDKMVATIAVQLPRNGQKSTMSIAKEVLERFKNVYPGYDIRIPALPNLQTAQDPNIDKDAEFNQPGEGAKISQINIVVAGFADPARANPGAATAKSVVPGEALKPGMPEKSKNLAIPDGAGNLPPPADANIPSVPPATTPIIDGKSTP